jgi:hypothetical protein
MMEVAPLHCLVWMRVPLGFQAASGLCASDGGGPKEALMLLLGTAAEYSSPTPNRDTIPYR